MTEQHPITAPPELVQQWADMLSSRSDHAVFSLAAQWGSDQELEACCEWLVRNYNYPEAGNPLRAARRPKPLSLKEQALTELEKVDMLWDTNEFGAETLSALDTIRRALESLDD